LKGIFTGEVNYEVKGKILIEAMGMDIEAPYEYLGSIPLSMWDILLK
jgi:hypothetical protein